MGKSDAMEIANIYDTEIYPKMIDTFGVSLIHSESGRNFSNPLEFADWMGNEDGKIAIFILQLPIGTIGYFWEEDLFNTQQASNLQDIIYIDISLRSTELFQTIAHEIQHIMNFATGYALRGIDGWQDIWIDEGLSAAAEWIVTGVHNQYRIDWFNNDVSGLIKLGNNFFVWGNYETPSALMDDYATVYLFFNWLRLQAGNNTILINIISSNHYDYRAVTTSMNTEVSYQGYSAWGTLLSTWMAANYINASDGPLGYMNDPVLKSVKACTVPSGTTSRNLFPGEGVYSITNSAPLTSGQGTNIRNLYLNTTTAQVREDTFYSSGAMLTYNSNTDIDGDRETGQTTGVAGAIMHGTSEGRYAALISSPVYISVIDLLRRHDRERIRSMGNE
jgi:hypothetical protein